MRERFRGLQFEIVSSLFLVNLTGVAIVAVVARGESGKAGAGTRDLGGGAFTRL